MRKFSCQDAYTTAKVQGEAFPTCGHTSYDFDRAGWLDVFVEAQLYAQQLLVVARKRITCIIVGTLSLASSVRSFVEVVLWLRAVGAVASDGASTWRHQSILLFSAFTRARTWSQGYVGISTEGICLTLQGR